MQSAQELGSSDWMLTMSKNKQVIQELSPLFKDKAFVKALGEAKTTEAIKDVFVKFNKESLFTKMPGEFTEILSKTKNTKKILDTMNYVEKYESLGKVMKILQNPSMKYAGRIFGRVLGVAGFAV
jgi:mannitol/fructose-specific phosphotransferase system IIA component (Ntr-type)